jgi:UDP-GlcNAc:undecaprenyl-phosphate/decaprenyl-phosphate GlcNAc-1-phosphate transferase
LQALREIISQPMVLLLTLSLVQTLLLSFLIALLLVRFSMYLARRYGILAHPSARGSHDRPTPRLGGLGIAAAFYITVLLMYRWAPRLNPSPWLFAIIVGGAYALCGGLLDDVLGLSPRWKFLFQFAAAGSALFFGFRLHSIALPGGSAVVLSPLLSAAVTVLFIIFLMNAYNFMDGMDGQAALFGMFVGIGVFTALAGQPRYELLTSLIDILIVATLTGALAGFLVFNMPTTEQPSKCFMGDSGSQFIGYMLALTALRMDQAQRVAFPTIAALILLSPFIWDVCFTLVRRLLRRENVLEAHRSHLYQLLLIAGWSHGRVLLINGVVWFSCVLLAHLYAFAHVRLRTDLAWRMIAANVLLLAGYTVFVMLTAATARRKPVAVQES